MEYHILTNINNKEPHQLQKPIENKNGRKKIGIKSITYYIGYFVFEMDECIQSSNELFCTLPFGMYSFNEIKEIFEKNFLSLNIEQGNFLVSLSPTTKEVILITNGVLSQLGFTTEGESTAVRKKFFSKTQLIPRELYVCLEEIKTSNNYKNGNPSTILEVLPVEEKKSSSYNFKRFDYPSFKPLINGDINEFKLSFKNEKNEDITKNIFYTIEFCIK